MGSGIYPANDGDGGKYPLRLARLVDRAPGIFFSCAGSTSWWFFARMSPLRLLATADSFFSPR
jgi:hypothetical protein